MRRGFLFTFCALVMGISVLSLAAGLADQSAKAQASVAALVAIDRAAWAHTNAEDMVVRVLGENTLVAVENATVTFTETLPRKANTADDLDRLAQFAALHMSPDTTLNLSWARNGTLVVQPVNATLTHGNTTVALQPEDTPASVGQLAGYAVDMAMLPGSFSDAQWETLANVSPNQSGLDLNIVMHDPNYAILREFDTRVDPHGVSRINITQGGGLVGHVQVTSPGRIEIDYQGNITLALSARFLAPLYVETADTVRVVGAANRTGRVRVA